MKKIKDGDWVRPEMSGFKLKCCDCGLVHNVDFAIVDNKEVVIVNGYGVVFRMSREENKKKITNKSK